MWINAEGRRSYVYNVEMSTYSHVDRDYGGLTYLAVEASFTVLCLLLPEGRRFHG